MMSFRNGLNPYLKQLMDLTIKGLPVEFFYSFSLELFVASVKREMIEGGERGIDGA